MPAELTIHDSSNENREPTIRDVLLAMSALDIRLTARIDSVSAKIDSVETSLIGKITALDRKSDSIFRSILEREDAMDARLRLIDQRLGKVETKIEDIQDDLTTALAAIDQDSLTLVSYGNRIASLESVIAA